MIPYSEDFSQSSWNKETGVVITSNYGTSPDGTQNSTRLQLNSINKSIYFVTGLGYASVFSIYIKGTKDEVIRVSNTGGTIHTFTGGWDRVECYDSDGTSPNVSINSYGGSTTALDMEIYGAMLEQNSFSTSYIPTSGAASTRLADIANIDLTSFTLTSITETISGVEQTPITVIPSIYTTPYGSIDKIIMI